MVSKQRQKAIQHHMSRLQFSLFVFSLSSKYISSPAPVNSCSPTAEKQITRPLVWLLMNLFNNSGVFVFLQNAAESQQQQNSEHRSYLMWSPLWFFEEDTCAGIFVALQGKCAARFRPSGQQDGVSATLYETLSNTEKEFTLTMLSFQVVLRIHTQLVLQTDKHMKIHSDTFTRNQLLNKTSTVMNIVLHLNMKNPLWQDILYWVWSTTICLF